MQGKKNLFRLLWVFVLLVAFVPVFGQGELYIFGVVKDYADGKKLEDVKITAYENGTQVDIYTTSSNGKYEFFLDLGKEYEVKFERKGLVSKKVYMDSRNIPEEDVGAGFSMNIEMSLFEEVEGLDITILDQPIGKAKYNPNTGALEFDFAYTQKIKDELNRLMRDWEKGSKDKQEADKEKEKELAELEKEFTRLVENADDAFLKEEYQSAVADYKEALKLKPDNPMVEVKLTNAEEKLVEQNAARVENEKYEAALKAGDDFMLTEDYEKAIGKYEEALGVKPNEKYPQEQIETAQQKIADKKKREAENEQFNALVQKGDNLVKAMDFEEGIAKYTEALAIKDDKEVEGKIKSAQDALAEYEEQKARQKEYDDLVAVADNQFKDEDYENAISSYEEALKIIPEEKHPTDRIAEAQKRIQEIEKQKEEERQQQELEEQFNALVAAGDEKMTGEDYSGAIGSYEEALELKPESQPVKDKINAARKQLESLEAQAEQEEQYNAAIADGDQAFKQEELETALGHFETASELKPEEDYPKNKIKEINDLLAEQARIAEEKRLEEERKKAEEKRIAEELEQFNNLVASGDEFFSKKEYQKAIDQYKAALEMKPENKHLPNKIKESEKLLEALRAQKNAEQNYQEAITEGDQKFKGQNYEGAIEAFERALEIKPDEEYPEERIAAANQAIADRIKQEEEAALEEQRLAEEAQRKEKEREREKLRDEFNRIVKLGDEFMEEREYQNAKVRYQEALELIPDDAPVQAKLLEADRLYNEMLSNREVDKEYNMVLADADAAFEVEDLKNALKKYREASDLKPGEQYPAERITEIEEMLEQQRKKAEQEKEAELEAQRKREREEEERRQMSEKEAEQAALDEEYNTYIEVADRKFEQSEYDVALRNYQEALALKPGEYYPKARIQEIELLIKEKEEREAEEERLAALERERENSKNNKRRGGASVDTQTEDEAERFMREARLREEAEKYERIKKLKEERASKIEKDRESETDRSENYQSQMETFREHSDKLYADATAANEEMSDRMSNYKNAVASGHSKEIEKEQENIDRARETVEDQEAVILKMRDKGQELHEESASNIDQEFVDQHEYVKEQAQKEQEKSQEAYNEVKDVQERIIERDERFDERQSKVTSEVTKQKKSHQDLLHKRIDNENEKIDASQKQINEQKEQQESQSAVMNQIVEKNSEDIQHRKERVADREKQYADLAEMRAKKAREDAHNVRANAPKEYDDYYLSQLAQEYPQGVTEESDNVGNKVIIRRVVVIGNKADEYRKVIDKTGKFYFKNGSSISERTWNSETNPDYD